MRFTGASDDDRVKEKRIVCGRKRGWQSERSDGEPGVPARPPRTRREHDYRLAGTFPASAADGIGLTRPRRPGGWRGTGGVAGAADAAAGIIPRAFRTSASSFAIVSL